MKFDECAKLFEMDVGGGTLSPYMVHGRNPDMKPTPEETVRMLEALVGKQELVTAEIDEGSLRLRMDGHLEKSGSGYVIRGQGDVGISVATFELKNVEKVMTDVKGIPGVEGSQFTVMLKVGI